MTTDTLPPLAKLEEINDLIAAGIDRAGEGAELFLAKALFHLAAHGAEVAALEDAIEASLRHLPAPLGATGA